MSEVICLSSSDDELDPKKKTNQSKKSKQADEPIENVHLKKRKASAYVGFHPLSKRSRTKITPKVEKDVPTSKENGIEVLKVVAESEKPEKSQKSKDLPENPPKNASKKGAEPMEEAWNRPSTSQQSMNPPEVPTSQKTQSTKPPKHPDAPQLVIREKRPVVDNHPGAEVFAQFLSQCLSRERSPQMEKILEKLKRIYDQLDQDYVRSSAFIDLLNEKRNLLLTDVRLYYHISDVHAEMKSHRRIAPVPRPKPSSEAQKQVPEEVQPEEVVETGEIDAKTDLRLRKILKVMEKCKKRIKELEEAELDFEDEENSHYIQVSRYKERMMQLYYKYCELTGEHEDAGRLYLRPKYLKVTQIESVDQAIVSFINKRLTEKVKKTKKGKSAADCIVFPDYVDMLNCIKKCNTEQKLGMSKSGTEQLAKKAFKELGEHLKKARQKDFLDTFSLLDIGGEDPATKDPVIAAKLRESSIEGKRRMDELLEEFVRRQKEGPADANEANGKKDGKEKKGGDGEDEEDGESKKSEDSEKSEDDEEDSEAEANDNDDDDNDNDNDVDSNSNDIEDLENVCGDKFDKITEEGDEELSTDDEEEEEDVAPVVPDVAAAAKDPEKMETDDVTTVLKNEISDSQETVLITPPTPKKQPHRVVCSFEGTIGKPSKQPTREVWAGDGALGRANRQTWDAEGTVTVDKTCVQLEKEAQMKKMQKLDPKFVTSPLKPTITNIQNVKVVIRAHEIVDINDKLREKCSNIGELGSRESEEKIAEKETEALDAVGNGPEASESAEASAEVIKNVEEEAKKEEAKPETDVMIVDDTPSVDTCPAPLPKTADPPENKILSPEKNVDAAIESADIPESQESIMIIDEIIKDTKPKNLVSSESKSDEKSRVIKRIAPTKLLSTSPKISKTSTPIKSMPSATSAQIDKFISHNEVIDETRATETREKVLEVSAIKKDSKDDTINNGNELSLGESLELEEKEAVDDIKAEIEASIDEDEKKPLLKLRSFAKPPDHWTSPPQKRPEITIKKTIKKSETIELVDLDDDDGKTNVITYQSKTSSKLVSSGNKKSPGVVRVTITLPSNKINKPKININEKSSISINTGTIASGTSSSSSSKQRGAGVIKIATVNPTTSNNRIVGQVRPMKNNNSLTISRIKKPVVIPYNRVQPSQAPAQSPSNNLSIIPIRNAIAGLSSIQNSVKSTMNNVNNDKQTENSKKKMCLNPVNRAVLTKVAQKVVNPVAKINLSQKTVSSADKSRPNAS